MKIEKDMRVCVSSEITPLDKNGLTVVGEESEKTVVNAAARFSFTDGAYTLSYKEKSEGGEIFTDVFFENGTVKVKRSGAILSEFVFSEGETNVSVYKIPPYSFDAEIKTSKIRSFLSEAGGQITVFYTMTIGGDMRAVKMRIEVYP